MIRILFIFIVVVHGLIHLLGFVTAFNLGKVTAFTGKTIIPLSAGLSKAMGIAWLLVCILFLATAVLFLLKKESWWIIGLTAVIISQILIIIYWQDARFGTVANIIILVGCLPSIGAWNFDRMVTQEINTFSSDLSLEEKPINEDAVAALPPVIQQWLDRAKVSPGKMPPAVFLTQQGEMKTDPDGNWMHLQARQYFTTQQPGFIWIADVQGGPLMRFAGRDKYHHEKGHMLIKLFSLLPVVNARGPEIDQGALLRYLAEMIWFPTVALHDNITWEQINASTAKATIHDGGNQATGFFYFDEKGDVTRFEAERYYFRKEGATLETWVIDIDENSFREFEGIRIPTQSTVTWKFKSGDFTWLKLEITDITYHAMSRDESPSRMVYP